VHGLEPQSTKSDVSIFKKRRFPCSQLWRVSKSTNIATILSTLFGAFDFSSILFYPYTFNRTLKNLGSVDICQTCSIFQ